MTLQITRVSSPEIFVGSDDNPRQILRVELDRTVSDGPLTVRVAGAGVSGTAEVAEGDESTTVEVPLDLTAIAAGSITAAAPAGSEPVRRVAALVSGDVRISRAQLDYAADVLGQQPPADPDVPVQRWHAELLDSARLEAFARWLNAAMHERVRLVHGLEHPGDSTQPDNLHRH